MKTCGVLLRVKHCAKHVTAPDLTLSLLQALYDCFHLHIRKLRILDKVVFLGSKSWTQASDSRVHMLSHTYYFALVREIILYLSGIPSMELPLIGVIILPGRIPKIVTLVTQNNLQGALKRKRKKKIFMFRSHQLSPILWSEVRNLYVFFKKLLSESGGNKVSDYWSKVKWEDSEA